MSRTVAIGKCLSVRNCTAKMIAAAGLGIMILTFLSGCGWIFGKQDKPMRVEVVLTGTPDLNFDGNVAHSVRVKVFLLTSASSFTGADKDVFFNPSYQDQLAAILEKDRLDSGSVIVLPSETATLELTGRFDKVKDAKPVLCAIADFYRSAGSKQERLALSIPKKTDQKVKIQIGRDSILKGKK